MKTNNFLEIENDDKSEKMFIKNLDNYSAVYLEKREYNKTEYIIKLEYMKFYRDFEGTVILEKENEYITFYNKKRAEEIYELIKNKMITNKEIKNEND